METILAEISKISFAESDKYATGYETWGAKQDLYQLKWVIERRLEECSTYAEEEEYVRKHEIKETLRALSK
jgi:hypothetical protein